MKCLIIKNIYKARKRLKYMLKEYENQQKNLAYRRDQITKFKVDNKIANDYYQT